MSDTAHSGKARIDGQGRLQVPARIIPPPPTISEEARRSLSTPMFPARDAPWPPLHDKQAWRAVIAARDASMAKIFSRLPPFSGSVRTHELEHASLYELVPAQLASRSPGRAVLYVHGGGYVMGAGALAVRAAETIAIAAQCRVYSVDYRMPPDHPFPAGLADTVNAWRFVLERHAPGATAIMGISAGGGLAASAVLKLRDEGLPLPGAALLLTPECDLTEAGDSFATNLGVDTVLQEPLRECNLLYAGGHDLRDPYLSAVFGDFTPGYPPTLLQSGTRDLFLSNTVLLHRALRRARVEAELHVFEAMPHGGFFGAPEDQEAMAEQLRFLDRHLH
jgi:monoterpene epsilon-lactone hydrolase